MTTIRVFLHRPLSLSRALLSHRFHTNSHKPWRAPPRTLLTTLWLQPSRPSTTKNSVQAVSEGGVREENSPRTFPRVEIPPDVFPYRACLREPTGWSAVPGSFCVLAWQFCLRDVYGDWITARVCFTTFCFFALVSRGWFAVVIWRRSVAGVPALGGQHPKKRWERYLLQIRRLPILHCLFSLRLLHISCLFVAKSKSILNYLFHAA